MGPPYSSSRRLVADGGAAVAATTVAAAAACDGNRNSRSQKPPLPHAHRNILYYQVVMVVNRLVGTYIADNI